MTPDNKGHLSRESLPGKYPHNKTEFRWICYAPTSLCGGQSIQCELGLSPCCGSLNAGSREIPRVLGEHTRAAVSIGWRNQCKRVAYKSTVEAASDQRSFRAAFGDLPLHKDGCSSQDFSVFMSPGTGTMKKTAEYKQAYLIGRREHLPADFPLAVDFEQVVSGMLVPARAYGRLRGLRLPAFIVLLLQTMLQVTVHPGEGGARKIIPLHEILAIESRQVFPRRKDHSPYGELHTRMAL